MQKLAEREAQELEREGDEDDAMLVLGVSRRQFLEDHIIAWVPRFCDRVI